VLYTYIYIYIVHTCPTLTIIGWMSWKRLGQTKETGGLGYRDLENFNLALLAKRGWRFIQNLYFLVAKVFQEKYFPSMTFLEAGLGRSPSFAWRSIWNSTKLLSKGLMLEYILNIF
jgi:hypothetical protein